jgi:hypothetical protein
MRKLVYFITIVLLAFTTLFLRKIKEVEAQSAFTFIAWADTRSGTSYLAALSEHAKKTFAPVFTIYPGDLVDGFSQINSWKNAINGGSSPGNGMFDITFPTRGNHDGEAGPWQDYFNLSQNAQNIKASNYNYLSGYDDLIYSFDYGNVRIIGLDIPGDVQSNPLSTATKTWLEQRLSGAQNRTNIDHVFINFHGPIYCCDGHCSGCTTQICSRDTGSSALTDLINILDKYPKVSATFHGHEHLLNYTHLDSSRNPNIDNPFEHFISGAAGMQYNDLGGMGYLCHPNRYDYFMDDADGRILRGYMAVTVSGSNYTVRFYSIDSSKTVRLDKTFNCTQSGGCSSGSTNSPTPKPTSSTTNTPTPTSGGYSCSRCSTAYQYCWAEFRSNYSDCSDVISNSQVYSTDCDCGPVANKPLCPVGNPSSCLSNTPTPSIHTGNGYAPIDDSFVSSSYTSSNYGGNSTAVASDYYSTDLRTAYLKFNLSNAGSVTSAALRLTAALPRAVEKRIYVTGTSWNESTINYTNRPSLGSQIATFNHLSSSLTTGEVVDIPLDAGKLVKDSSGNISIAIDNTGSGNTFEFYSKEGTSPPLLIVNSGNITPTPPPGGCPPGYLPGDGNGDCTVDGIDYGIWYIHYGQTVSGGSSEGNYNESSDGKVDGIDYGVWYIHYNESVSPPGTVTATKTLTTTSTKTPTISSTKTPTPTSGGTATPTPTPIVGCYRPYTDGSPWNTPAGGMPTHPNSGQMIGDLYDSGSRKLSSSTDMYTYPVYEVNNSTPTVPVRFSGFYKYVNSTQTQVVTQNSGSVDMPIPSNAQAASGTDGQLIAVNHDTGDEWAFWQGRKNSDGSWSVTNAYRYNIDFTGYPPQSFSRGAGVPYLAGLIRPCEIKQGHIPHAIAFAYNYPCSSSNCGTHGWDYYVYPATKSDGKGSESWAIPEGARLQLQASDSEISSWCSSRPSSEQQTCNVIGKALREYGMIVIDNSGSPKIYAEYDSTARWGLDGNPDISRSTPGVFPINRFRVIDFCSDQGSGDSDCN